MSPDIAERTPQQKLVARVRSDDFRAEIKLALPENVSLDRFTRATITALLQTPALIEADRTTLFQAVIKSAQDGLMPDGREAALVIYGGKVAYLPMISGFRKIAGEHGWMIRTAVVYENDVFEYELGLNERLDHRPTRVGMDRGQLVAAYAVGVHRDGRREFEVMTVEDVEKIRKASRAASRGPWVDWTERMYEKTAGRRLFAKLPLADDERVARIVEADTRAPGEAVRMLYGPPVAPPAELAQGPQAETAPPADEPAAGGFGETPAGVDVQEEDIDWPGPDETDEAREVAALQAALYNPASQKWPGMTLGEIWQEGDKARDYFKWCLKNAKKPAFVDALRDFTGFYAPELLHEALAEAEVAS